MNEDKAKKACEAAFKASKYMQVVFSPNARQPYTDGWIAALQWAASQQAAEGWRPIETAPSDDVALLCARDGYITMDRWGDFAKYNMPKFTHWMPLPAPPSTQGGADETA